MRSREEIEKEMIDGIASGAPYGAFTIAEGLTLEVLLDIRDLLTPKP